MSEVAHGPGCLAPDPETTREEGGGLPQTCTLATSFGNPKGNGYSGRYFSIYLFTIYFPFSLFFFGTPTPPLPHGDVVGLFIWRPGGGGFGVRMPMLLVGGAWAVFCFRYSILFIQHGILFLVAAISSSHPEEGMILGRGDLWGGEGAFGVRMPMCLVGGAWALGFGGRVDFGGRGVFGFRMLRGLVRAWVVHDGQCGLTDGLGGPPASDPSGGHLELTPLNQRPGYWKW